MGNQLCITMFSSYQSEHTRSFWLAYIPILELSGKLGYGYEAAVLVLMERQVTTKSLTALFLWKRKRTIAFGRKIISSIPSSKNYLSIDSSALDFFPPYDILHFNTNYFEKQTSNRFKCIQLNNNNHINFKPENNLSFIHLYSERTTATARLYITIAVISK